MLFLLVIAWEKKRDQITPVVATDSMGLELVLRKFQSKHFKAEINQNIVAFDNGVCLTSGSYDRQSSGHL